MDEAQVKIETEKHIQNVNMYINTIIYQLIIRGMSHDKSKLEEPEFSIFREYTEKLKHTTYGSDEYKQYLKEMQPALAHHYANNRHHPEWSTFNGIIKKEEWKDIIGYEGLYQVSNWGQVRSLTREIIQSDGKRYNQDGQIRKAHIVPKGYYRLQLSKDGETQNYFVHQLVAEHFISNPENKPQVNHKNTIKTDNYIDNLEWSTNSENQIHAYKNGLQYTKYVVHCIELNITTLGTGEMERKLKELGYKQADDSLISLCIYGNNESHLGFHFEGFVIEEHETSNKSLIDGMTIIDIVEMFADWKSATLRHADGDLNKSIDINAKRFNISPQLTQIFKNSVVVFDLVKA